MAVTVAVTVGVQMVAATDAAGAAAVGICAAAAAVAGWDRVAVWCGAVQCGVRVVRCDNGVCGWHSTAEPRAPHKHCKRGGFPRLVWASPDSYYYDERARYLYCAPCGALGWC